MSFKKPINYHPKLEKNNLGLTRRDYEGAVSTLCAGCGHDSISACIIESCFKLNIEAYKVAKLSGIGCSSKAPAYFLNQSHGFNSVHGRMPSVATGANCANRDLMYLGVSGDGDSASIGVGQFIHAVRRQVNMVYIIENNGTYGLTKGQFSATNDLESKNKYGDDNLFKPIDLATMAIQLGATYVARSFSGDREQLVPLIMGAMQHKGFALLDIISPCVTFNNHASSTKSYDYIRDHNEAVGKTDFVPLGEEISTSYEEGSSVQVNLHDGSKLSLEKTDKSFDPCDAGKSLGFIREKEQEGKVLTGLLYADSSSKDLIETLNMTETPLNQLEQNLICPGKKNLEEINIKLS
jgi:2-oxoglutarate ferredoxin oxidoreductase subunit beta